MSLFSGDLLHDTNCVCVRNHTTNITSTTMDSCKKLETVIFERKSIIREFCNSAFERSFIKSIFIPRTVEVIGYKSFAGCVSLELVNFEPNSRLKRLGFQAFAGAFKPGCKASLTLPDSLQVMENACFMNSDIGIICLGNTMLRSLATLSFGCSQIQRILIPKSVQFLKGQCFHDCYRLSSVEFEEGSELVEIGPSAFRNTALKHIKIPNKVVRIGYRCFDQCVNMETIELNSCSSLKEIGSSAFSLSAIRDIFIPDGLETATGAFVDSRATITLSRRNKHFTVSDGLLMTKGRVEAIHCFTPIHSIRVPESTRKLAVSCFEGCQTLETVEFDENGTLEEIGEGAFRGSSISSIEIPSTVRTIGIEAFGFCGNLTNIRFARDSAVEELPIRCFMECQFSTIEIPRSVKVICDECFAECSQLTFVVFQIC